MECRTFLPGLQKLEGLGLIVFHCFAMQCPPPARDLAVRACRLTRQIAVLCGRPHPRRMLSLVTVMMGLLTGGPTSPLRAPDAPSLSEALNAPTPPMAVAHAAFSAAPCRASAPLMAVATRPKPKSSAVTRRGGGQLISWYFNSISSTRLLDREQEQQLSQMIIAGDEYERLRDELEDELGRRPSTEEWAAAVGLEKRELRKRMRRANSARDLMVAANSV